MPLSSQTDRKFLMSGRNVSCTQPNMNTHICLSHTSVHSCEFKSHILNTWHLLNPTSLSLPLNSCSCSSTSDSNQELTEIFLHHKCWLHFRMGGWGVARNVCHIVEATVALQLLASFFFSFGSLNWALSRMIQVWSNTGGTVSHHQALTSKLIIKTICSDTFWSLSKLMIINENSLLMSSNT